MNSESISQKPMDSVKKYRIVFWVSISIFAIIITTGVYFAWRNQGDITQLILEKDQKIAAQSLEISKLNKATSTTESSSSEIQKTNAQLTEENETLKAGIKKANTYNDFSKYLTSVIKAHSGFTGWTDAEFAIAKTKAEATANTNFVSTINWAWYEVSVPSIDRVIRVWEETATGIESSLK